MSEHDNRQAIYSISRKDRAHEAVERTRVANKSWADRRKELRNQAQTKSTWKRESYKLPREEARELARKFFTQYPKAAYWSEVENWRVAEDGMIEFTMRRLPTAD